MKRFFCVLLAFIVLPVIPARIINAADGVAIVSVTPDRYYAYVGQYITYTVSITGDTTGDVRYDYYVYVNGQRQDSSLFSQSANTFEVLCLAPGAYTLGCRVYKNIPGTRQIAVVFPPDMISPVSKVDHIPKVHSVSPDKTSAKTNESIIWTAVVTGGIPPLKYNWNIMCDGNTIMACSGGMKMSGIQSCLAEMPGLYSAEVWVYDDGGSAVQGQSAVSVPVKQGLVIKSLEADRKIAKTGENIRWTILEAIGGAGSKSYQYSFDVYRDNALLLKNPWNKSINFTLKADKPGSYYAYAYVTDGMEQAAKVSSVTKVADPLSILSVKANRVSAPVGAEIIWTITTAGGADPQYGFDLYKGTQLVSGSGFTASNAYTWATSSAGSFHVTASAFDAFGDLVKKDSAAIAVSVSSTLSVKSVHVDKASAAVGENVTWTAAAMGGSGSKSYKFEVYKNGVKLPLPASFTASAKYNYTPNDPGKYKVAVYVKDSSSSTASPVYSAETVISALVPLSAPLPFGNVVFSSPSPVFSPVLLPGNVSIQMTSMPTAAVKTATPTITPKPTAAIMTAAPEPAATPPAPDETLPVVVLVTGLQFFTLAPTVGID